MYRALVAAITLIGLAVLVGLTVPTGAGGATGPTGGNGPTGCSGPTGSVGPTGECGPSGPQRSGPSDYPPCTGCFPPSPGPGPTGPSQPSVLAGVGALTDNANDSYVAWGVALVSGTANAVSIPIPVGGTLSELRVFATTAPGAGASWTFTIDKNASSTALTCSMAGPATSCGDSSLLTVAAADELDLHATPFGTPALATVKWSAVITP